MEASIFRIEDKSNVKRYSLAILAAIAALLLRELLAPLLGDHSPFVTVWAAIIFAVWCCGTGPSLVTAAIGLVGVWYWFLPPTHSFLLQDAKADISTMVGFLLLSGLIIALGEGDRRSQRRLRQEIAERLQADKNLRESEAEAMAATAKFRALFEQTPVLAGIMTTDGIMVDANRLCLEACGYRREEVLGRVFWETGWWRKSPEAQAKIRSASRRAAAGDPYRETLTYHWADGTERLVDFALHPIRDGHGDIIFLHPTGIDITDFKRVEIELRKSHDELEERVRARTQELAASLGSLESEIVLRKTTEKALRELSARTLRLQDEERRRFARDLHDSTGQTLVALKMTLASLTLLVETVPKAAGLLNDLEALADQALQEIRTTSHLLHPPLLDEVGFSSAAQWYIDGFAARSGVKTNLELSVKPRLTKDEELVFFRILQESLTNVLRHSGSKTVDIRLDSDQEDAILTIRDSGKGIPAKTLNSFRETAAGVGVGLGGMKQRVRELGGHLRVDSDQNGTCIVATLPLTKEELNPRDRAREIRGIPAD
jgi:PAS domain S-box-containing protein